MRTCGIYEIKNTINNKRYIGQSVNIEKRIKRHKTALKNNTHDNKHLQHAYNKYREDCFVFNIICQCCLDELDEKEIFYIKKYDSFHNGYNLTQGGDYNPNYNQYGINNKSSKYTLWDTSKCAYQTIKNKDMNQLWKCFRFKYKDFSPKMGCIFHDFYTPELIHDLTVKAVGEEVFLKKRNTTCHKYRERKKNIYEKHKQNIQTLESFGIDYFISLVQQGWTQQRIIKEYCVSLDAWQEFLFNHNYTWKQISFKFKPKHKRKKHKKILTPKERAIRQSKSVTTSGVLYVYCENNKRWIYHKQINNQNIRLSAKSIEKLHYEVLSHGLEWTIVDTKKYLQSQQKVFNKRKKQHDSFQIIESNNLLLSVVKGIQKKYNQKQIFTFLSKQYDIPYNHLNAYLLYKNISWDNIYYYAHIDKIQQYEQEIILLFAYGYTKDYIEKKFNFNRKIFTNFCQYNQYKTCVTHRKENHRNRPNTTGYYRVDKQPGKRYKNGFTYRYTWKNDKGNIQTLKSTNINKLEEKVKNQGLLWKKVPIKS